VAIVGGQVIYYDDLIPSIKPQLVRLRTEEYEIDKKALDSLIDQKLLELAAQRKGVSEDKLIEQEITSKIADPTEAELKAFYLGQKDRFAKPFPEVKDQVRDGLKQARIQQARQEYVESLRKNDVLVLLPPPRVHVGYDPARVRGNAKSPVMIVEFSDFQCPFCRQAERTVRDLLARYPGRVSLAYRDLPLTQIHPQAEVAAEASRCAGEQGKFWEYHDELFNASDLQPPALLEYARALKLDAKQFEGCLSSDKYKAEVKKDIAAAAQAGVAGTPGFFINGIPLSGAQSLDRFAAFVEEELARKQ
jgi:protein-disulfide isomerase